MARLQMMMSSVASIALLAGVPAFAQVAVDDEETQPATPTQADKRKAPASDVAGVPVEDLSTQDIIVTGFRASLETAEGKKRVAPNVVEVLSAEDIGKLPDPSIGESLARLPGVAQNRDRGNATQLSIRGMGPELVNTLINGREIVSAESSRNVRYEQYPAELITGAYIYKSPTASQAEGAIAGQVDMLTIRPLTQKKSVFVLNARGSYAPQAKELPYVKAFGYNVVGSYIGKFADDTIGFAIGYSRSDEPTASQLTAIYPYVNSFSDLNSDGVTDDQVPSGFLALQRTGRQRRDAALGTVQFAPGNGLEVVADLMWSKLNYAEYQRGFQADSLAYGNYFQSPPTVVNNGAVAGNIVNYFDYGVRSVATNQFYGFKDQLWAGGLNVKYDNDDFTIIADAGYSETVRRANYVVINTRPYYRDASGNFQPVIGVSATTNAVPPLVVSYTSRDNSPASFGFSLPLDDPATNLVYDVNAAGAPITTDALFTGRFDVQRKFQSGFLSAISAGIRHTDRQKENTLRSQYLVLNGQPVPDQFLLAPTRFRGEFSDLPQAVAIDMFPYIQSIGGLNPVQTEANKGGSWRVLETTYSGYLTADFDSSFGGMQLTGNAGIRYVRTLGTSIGNRVVNGTDTNFIDVATPVRVANNYSDWLPAFNATLKLNNRMQIRAAASKAIARPPLDALSASYNLYNYSAPSAYGGNPNLKPWRATQADATFELYLKDATFTVAGFYKKLDTFIVTQVTAITETTPGGVVQQGTYEQPVNGEGGNVKGVEFSFKTNFTFLPGFLRGTGAFGNYSYTDSSITVNQASNPISNIPLPNLSKHVGNLGMFFNSGGFESRVGFRARSSFAQNVGGQNLLTFNKGDQLWDAFVGYNFSQTSALPGMRISLQASNLTNRPFRTYSGFDERQGRYENSGRQFFLTAGIKL